MSDPIKREDALNALLRMDGTKIDKALAMGEIRSIPSADRLQGEWLKFGLGRGTRILFCTNCERRIEVPLSQGNLNYDFCPNCGADMKEREDE